MPKTTTPPPPTDWPGFTAPAYTPIPDEVFDVWLPHLSGAELKVLLYICRRTFGWKKDADAISLAQLVGGIRRRDGTWLDYGTGLARSTVLVAIDGLERHGLITVERSATAAQDNEANTYRPRMAAPGTKIVPAYAENRTRAGRMRAPALARVSGPQETPVQETTQEEEGPPLAAVLPAFGKDWGTLQARAAAVCAARGWTPAQLARELAARPEPGLRRKLEALEREGV